MMTNDVLPATETSTKAPRREVVHLAINDGGRAGRQRVPPPHLHGARRARHVGRRPRRGRDERPRRGAHPPPLPEGAGRGRRRAGGGHIRPDAGVRPRLRRGRGGPGRADLRLRRGVQRGVDSGGGVRQELRGHGRGVDLPGFQRDDTRVRPDGQRQGETKIKEREWGERREKAASLLSVSAH